MNYHSLIFLRVKCKYHGIWISLPWYWYSVWYHRCTMVLCMLCVCWQRRPPNGSHTRPDSQELIRESFCSRALDLTASAEMKINEFRFQEDVLFYLWSDCFWQLRVTAAPGELIFGKPHSGMPLFCCVCVSVCVDSACMPCCISAFISQLVLFFWLHVSLVVFPAHDPSADRTWPSLFNCSPVIVCYFEEWSPASRLSVECLGDLHSCYSGSSWVIRLTV